MGNSANDAIERRRAESLALRRQLDGEPEPAAAPEPTDPAPTESPQHRPPRPRRRTGRRIALAVLLVLIVGGVGVAGRFHCVYGGPTSGGKIKYVTLVQKTEWGLYDQFVDLDKVVRWDVPRMLEHARTIRALVAAKWLGAEDLPAYQRELLDELGRQGFWCTGKTCKTTREACEAVRGQSTKATQIGRAHV